MGTAEQAPTDAQDHRPVPVQERGKGLLIVGLAKSLEQLRIGSPVTAFACGEPVNQVQEWAPLPRAHDPSPPGMGWHCLPSYFTQGPRRFQENWFRKQGQSFFASGGGSGSVGSPNTTYFIAWKKMLGGYQSSLGTRPARFSLS